MALDNSIIASENDESLNNDEIILKNDDIVDDSSSLNNESINIENVENIDKNEIENNVNNTVENDIENKNSSKVESSTLNNQEPKMNDDLNKIIIVNLSNDDDDNTSIPTPTITTVKAIDADLDNDDDSNIIKNEDNIISPTNSIDINVTSSVNEVSTETNNVNDITENTTERVIFAEPFDEDEEGEELANNDSSLSDIDLDQMISEQLNTDFTEVDLNSTMKDVNRSISSNNMESISADIMNKNGQMSLQQIIDDVDSGKNSPVSIGSTTADIINSSLMKLNGENNDTVDESIVEKLNTSIDSIADSESIHQKINKLKYSIQMTLKSLSLIQMMLNKLFIHIKKMDLRMLLIKQSKSIKVSQNQVLNQNQSQSQNQRNTRR
eukprot:jgi/Orpsp1_1/1174299/evm.model.c7180000049593.1